MQKLVYYELNESRKFLHVYTWLWSVLNSLQKHASKRRKTLRALVYISFQSLQNVHWTFCNSNSRKPFEKGLTLNFTFCKRNKSKVFSDCLQCKFNLSFCSFSVERSQSSLLSFLSRKRQESVKPIFFCTFFRVFWAR